ncbi:MAG: ferrochelatase [Campylobacter sp.]|nr:ferrochelatase [Campylobacter sp.]
MYIQDLLRLLRGELENRPAITQINGFAFEPKHIKQGYAFIADECNEEDIAQAIKNGAYAVISDARISISDTEIAYILVDNLRFALFRLMRYEASQKKLKFFYVNPVQMAILKRLNLSKNATILSENIAELFLKILKAGIGESFFSSNSRTLERISPFYDQVFSDTKSQNINSGSIFFSNVICDEIFYQNLSVPRVFLPAFCGLLKFLKSHEIDFKLGDMKNLEHFEPIFIDKNFKPVNFGSSFRAIIAESDEELFCIEHSFLQKHFDDVKFCLPKNCDISVEGAIFFDKLSEIKELKNFRYALILCNKTELINMLNEGEDKQGKFEF